LSILIQSDLHNKKHTHWDITWTIAIGYLSFYETVHSSSLEKSAHMCTFVYYKKTDTCRQNSLIIRDESTGIIKQLFLVSFNIFTFLFDGDQYISSSFISTTLHSMEKDKSNIISVLYWYKLEYHLEFLFNIHNTLS